MLLALTGDMTLRRLLAVAVLSTVPAHPLLAQTAPASSTPPHESQDKTGTNPLVLTYMIQPSNEFYDLPDDLTNNVTKIKLSVPFAGRRASLAFTPQITTTNSSSAVLPGGIEGGGVGAPAPGAVKGNTHAGLGDVSLKGSYVAYFNPRLKLGVLAALELNFATATEPVFGLGMNTIMPSVTVAMFPARNIIFAPVYKQSNSYSGDPDRDDVNQGAIDLYFVYLFNGGKNFVNVDPQMIFNYQHDTFSAVAEVTGGFVLSKEKGLTLTITPGFPIGGTKPYDFLFKCGIKKVF
jgi:hypothetical protein